MDESGSNQNQGKGQPSISPSPGERNAAPPRILVVEDSKTDVFLIREAVANAQVKADLHFVSDGDAAIQFFDSADADANAPCAALVVLDLNLPKKSGHEVLRHLRSSRKCGNAPVLIVSSSDAVDDRQRIAGLGVNGYFRKPSDYYDFMKLGDLVKKLLRPDSNLEMQ
jgi:chemotaxis family two-component system response regulator Rcp1